MITKGGELSFVTRMFHESSSNPMMKSQVKWYTSLLGRKENVNAVEALCKEGHVARFKFHTLKQAKTSRWIVAWSWQDS